MSNETWDARPPDNMTWDANDIVDPWGTRSTGGDLPPEYEIDAKMPGRVPPPPPQVVESKGGGI